MTNPAQENVNEGTSSRANKQKGKVSKRVRSRASSPPCAACKKMRKKCSSDCIFAPYFGSSQGSARFEAVHKVFGANNLSKLLLEVEVAHRNEVINSMCYEAQARLANPVHGCVSTISALQQQVCLITQCLNSCYCLFVYVLVFFFIVIFLVIPSLSSLDNLFCFSLSN